ncbi:hypothetical protein CEXT_219371 [Caerostris extrusa]|uniref:Uncharacterized protein n=1 Tax=Caerostris extrusa TaxID=172846 RepID=A0AAV4RHJ0_CAEEX|nr:hypothetical protein CEXT_219371 [Caerostris extrusa]
MSNITKRKEKREKSLNQVDNPSDVLLVYKTESPSPPPSSLLCSARCDLDVTSEADCRKVSGLQQRSESAKPFEMSPLTKSKQQNELPRARNASEQCQLPLSHVLLSSLLTTRVQNAALQKQMARARRIGGTAQKTVFR